MFWYYDSTYILVIIGAVLCLIASAQVKSTYAKYQKVRSLSGMTGAQAAEKILQYSGIYDVSIARVSGNLTDHYDPRNKVLNLSDAVYDNNSVAAIGVAAHECGHAIQDNKGYAALRFRAALVPVANFGATISWPIIILGVVFGYSQSLINIGIILFSSVVIFQLVTLPVEFNASRRAVNVLNDSGILYDEEIKYTKKVLGAAALTYVAGAASVILQLLRLVLLFGGRDRD
jgi:Zn-dependent membrane protease YugP